MSKSFLMLLLLFFFTDVSYPQFEEFGVGIKIGPGTISGNLPSQTSVTTEIFIDVLHSITKGIPLRLGVVYSRKFEAFLPKGLQGKYYPFVKGLYLNGVLKQPLGKIGYLEEALGPLLLNDRTYSDVNSYDIGVTFSLLIGLDFRDIEKTGFTSGLGIEYGSTFTNTTARYSVVYLQGQYFF